MNELLVKRVKNSLNMQHYTMNDSWLSDCIEYYLTDHANASQEEIITFVMNQWVLYDLREINNENGCLPRGLAKQKCTMLPSKYILQMDKIYDISQSKYKQLEKIRNVSSENVEATERENVIQEDKFQNYEPKTKRMLQLFLTDGVQDVLAIEFKPIRFLKDDLYPGFKVMIKGPVVCRKGVILLEEKNIAEIGGEVDSLLIINAKENVFARALNLEENPDPYDDSKAQKKQTQKTDLADDDFDMDSQVIDQIEQQIQQQNTASSENLVTSTLKNKSSTLKNKSSTLKNKSSTLKDESSTLKNIASNFDDDGDLFFEMVDDKTFENISTSKTIFAIPQPVSNKQSSSSKAMQNPSIDDFPMDDEVYDLTEDSPPSSSKANLQSKTNVFKKATCSTILTSNKNPSVEQKSEISKSTSTNFSSKNKNISEKLQSTSNAFNFPDDDFDLGDVNMETDDFSDYLKKNSKAEIIDTKSSQSSGGSTKLRTNISTECLNYQNKSSEISENSINVKSELNSIQKLESEFKDICEVEFEAISTLDYKPFNNQQLIGNDKKTEIKKIDNSSIKSENWIQSNSAESMRIKRLGSTMSPPEETPQKIRCVQSTPKSNKNNERKITDFLTSKQPVLNEKGPKAYELLKDVLKESLTQEQIQAIVRGKVIKIVKLNLLKNENGSYFHLEGTITDNTANLDVVFSTQVLEKIIGYSPQEFSQKRKQSKNDPSIKDQLREDLKRAQQILTVMDELMEIEIKKNQKALILNSVKLTKEQKQQIDDRVKALNK